MKRLIREVTAEKEKKASNTLVGISRPDPTVKKWNERATNEKRDHFVESVSRFEHQLASC